MTYHRDEVKAPRVSGVALKAFVRALESGLGPLLLNKLVRDSGLERFRQASAGGASPVQVPLPHGSPPKETGSQLELAARAVASPAKWKDPAKLETVGAFARAYRAGQADPLSVVRRLHEAIDRIDGRDDRMGFFISRKPDDVLRAAQESAGRLESGTARSALEGVPVVLKDEFDLEGFATTLGTKFRKDIAKADSVVAARLKAAGAVILGKANMNEIGINPIGLNPHYGPARNPWNRGHIAGGSSSGSGAAIAAGLCPIAIGADGGGSIRIPAGLCGVVGLKATFGRIPGTGVPPLCWNVAHVGPMGLSVDDVAAAYAVIAGPDEQDAISWSQPPLHLTGYEGGSLEGVRLGICWPHFEDAEPDVVARCKDAVKACTDAGAKEVEIPPPDLNTILWAHSCIILSEMAAGLAGPIREDVTRFGLDSRLNLAIGRHFRATDLVHAMRHRHKLTREYLDLMGSVDAVVTPTTGITAPAIPEATLPDGESNLPVVDALMRFIRVGNLTGFPALAVPAGFDRAGLPVSVHFLARPWEEHLLFRLGRAVEASVEKRRPPVHVRVLE